MLKNMMATIGQINASSSNEIHLKKVKPISLFCRITENLVINKMINMSVMMHYKEPVFQQFLNDMFSLLTSITNEELMHFVKQTKYIYEFLEVISRDYFDFFLIYTPEIFSKIFRDD